MTSIEEVMSLYKNKIERSILPPDPLRIVKTALRIPVTVEHILPIPPFIEKIHSEVVEPGIEKAPRLPLTGDFPVFKWKEWIKE